MPKLGFPDLALYVFRLLVIWPVGFVMLRFVPTRLGLAVMKRLRLDLRAAWEWERLSFLSDSRKSVALRMWRLRFWSLITFPGLGLAWGCAMEASYRIYVLGWFVLGPDKAPLSHKQTEYVRALIRRESDFVLANLETHSFNNHYAFNVFSLLIANMVNPVDDARWRGELERVLRGQFLPDGTNFEASTSYHLLMLEALTRLAILRPDLKGDIKAALNLEGALSFARQVAPDDRLLWRIGDTDGSQVVKDGCSLTELSSKAWSITGSTVVQRESFEDFGAIFFKEGNLDVGFWMPHPGQDGRAGHNHADALTLTCAINNRTVIGDPGVPLYALMRKWFRSAQQHSGPFPEGIEPLIQVGPFRTADHWVGSLCRLSPEEALATCEQLPDEGYRRQVKIIPGAGMEITDSSMGLLPPPCPKLALDPQYKVLIESPLRVRLVQRDGNSPDLIIEALEGIAAFKIRRSWYSPAYFRLSLSVSLSMESTSTRCRWRLLIA